MKLIIINDKVSLWKEGMNMRVDYFINKMIAEINTAYFNFKKKKN